MPTIKVHLHFVWTTKNRNPLLSKQSIRDQLWQHIRENAKNKNIHILEVGGHCDHCHCLISLNKDQTISKIGQLLKGESSFWINRSGLITDYFEWQDEYYVESTSIDSIPSVINYIQLQEEHHRKYTFEEEVEKFFIEYYKELRAK